MKNHSRPKRWAYAKTKLGQRESLQNSNIEAVYHQVINAVKTLYMRRGGDYFERDYKTDKSHGILCMHSFITSNFYWILDCELGFQYKVTFAFDKCPFEAEVRKLLRAYPLSESATEVILQPDLATFYKNVLAYQDRRFHLVLKG